MRVNVVLATDGCCLKNPGIGGYAGILESGPYSKEYSGAVEMVTTNNQMELMAVIAGIEKLERPCHVVIETDSMYVCNGIASGPTWAKNGWKLNGGGKPKNMELWKRLMELTTTGNHTLAYQYIKGHSGNKKNERCDFLAKEAAKRKKEELNA